MIKFIFKLFLLVGVVVLFLSYFIFVDKGARQEEISWGVSFSVSQAEYLGLDWQRVYTSLLDDMLVRNFRLIAEWNSVEPKEGEYDFSALDTQLSELQKRGGKAILVLGMKTPRWPECHVPDWASMLSKEKQQEKILTLLKAEVEHLRSQPAITIWQIENEPFLSFGKCPWQNTSEFLKKEIIEIKSADTSHPVMVTDSGEWSLLFKPYSLGDIAGTTLYRSVWYGPLNHYVTYPFSSAFYERKVWLIKNLFHKEVINVELQAEPWAENGLKDATFEDNQKTLTIEQMRDNIEFARHAGSNEIYLWGAEWWYYMKENGHPEFWKEAKQLFKENN